MVCEEILRQTARDSRRQFLKRAPAGAAALVSGGVLGQGGRPLRAPGRSRGQVSLVAGGDPREVAYKSLKPFEDEIAKAISGKQVVIKVNVGQVDKDVWLNASDVNQIRGILDFLKPVYDKTVVIGEGTATPNTSTFVGYRNFGYLALEREYKVKLVDLNGEPTVVRSILAQDLSPLPVNLIHTYLDPSVYLISATRLKNSGGVVATLSLKNAVMGAPVHHWRQRAGEWVNEKHKIHSWKGPAGRKGQNLNIFLLAQMGIAPDLAVLDGTTGMEGNGPVKGTPVKHGVGLAGTDWLACDRLAVELMGYDWNLVRYLKWCGDAVMGEADLGKMDILGPDYRKHIVKYKRHDNYEGQIAWIFEDTKEGLRP